MNKIILVLIIIVVLVLGVVVYFAYTNNYSSIYNGTNYGNIKKVSDTNVTPNTNVTPSANNQPATGTQPVQSKRLFAAVGIQNFAFNPTTLNIKVGTTVTWVNNDPVPHQIKSDTFNSNILTNGQKFQFTFSSVGEYSYSCAIHTYMLGKIIVTQ